MANKFEDFGKKYGTIIAIAVALCVWLLPTPETMTITQHKLLTIFSGAVVVWITLSMSIATSTMMLVPILYLWVGNPTGAVNEAGHLIRSAKFAISGFGSPALWLLVTGFIISTAMTETGIAQRLALVMMKRFGKTPLGAILTPMFANLLISPLTPSNTARTAAMLPIVEGVAQAYQVEKGKSNFGKALFLSNTFASNITAGGFQTATIPNPISIALIAAALGTTAIGTTWGYWTLAALPTTILVLIGTPLLLRVLFKPEMTTIPGGIEYVDRELKKMGPLSREEIKALLYFILALVLWSTDAWHKMSSAMLAFLVSGLILAPSIGVLSWKQAEKKIPWELFVYFGGVITLSNTLIKTEAFAWVITTGMQSLGLDGVGMLPLMIGLMGFTIFSHMIWSTTTAMAGVMIPIYIGMATAFNFPVVAFVLPQAILMGYALFFPFNTMGNIIMFGAGYYTVTEQLKSSVLVGLMAWALWAATALIWFPMIGLY
ncbi:DASS family sodium-coupled anion symporter [Pseudodesulfovibrio sp. JC047]|uniref:DASS family sodium-coupled anion symporter n=1 Tax=Pseudodesulfovibrio sp. JC047 TaxID=2683199 RepID=UPI0013D7164A|nr:DASS family sodium-coupled anion symporter [Pseudodesulfovibrio sp. JC047]NDV18373.1 DASS family sodium-coupled anion symporter [Pseudodesulfovibrio sp. JC047]